MGDNRHSRLNEAKITPAADPHFVRFSSRRSVVYSTGGMVASSEPLASEAGAAILRKGGNAADAAVATAAALNVTEPCSTGIGGDMFCLYYDAKTKKVSGLNGSGRSPAALTLDACRKAGIKGRDIPLKSALSVTVPGSAAGLCDTVSTFGSGKLSMEQILAPAIKLAEDGFPVSEITAFSWNRSENLLKTQSPNGNEMLAGGKAPKVGEIMQNPTLAETFRTVAREGKNGFYKGRIAQAIVDVLKPLGGCMTLEDLAAHTSTPIEPITFTYHGVTLHECPPNGQGLTALMALGILESLERSGKIDKWEKWHQNSPEYLHALIESLRIAFADTRYYVTDPDVEHVPVKEMLSKDYLDKRAALFSPDKANAELKRGSPVNSSDTTYFSVTDKDGNACSFIISNYAGFGTGIIPKGCGFTLQNRGSNFNLEENHPNMVKPNKRPYHTIIPAMATKGDELYLNYGVMGGFMQPQGHVQVLMNLMHFGLNPQTALDAPRICIGAGMPDVGDVIDSTVYIEHGIDTETIEKLRKMGHAVEELKGFERGMFGRGQVIERIIDSRTGKRVWAAGSDLRADGQAVPQEQFD